MSITTTISQINQACEDLQDAYQDLAEEALPAYDRLNSSIGRLTQWEVMVSSGGYGGATTFYQDSKPRWWEKFVGVITVGEVPHPDADKARDAAKVLFGDIATNDDVYSARSEDIASTPKDLGEIMGEWLGIVDVFDSQVAQAIPSSTAYIPTSGGLDGWRSPRASSGYEATASSQNSAAETTAEVVRALLENCAGFLEHLKSSLVAFATLTMDQNRFYSETLTSIPTEISLDAVLGLIETGANIVNTLKEAELKQAEAMGSDLTSTITALLNISALDGQITRMGETSGDGGWPQPAPMDPAHGGSNGPAARDELSYNTQYFKDHIDFWDGISETMTPLGQQATGIPELPVMFLRLPSFSANQSTALNSLGDRVASDCLVKGSTATATVATKLGETIRSYVRTEAANEAIANRIINDHFGG
ncbi:hypothetical protein [Tessaracoccus antarcticus]|uniref:Uncharacterized protein n=1 Tax=Tessaracoccus antarcticus TaxID=2479848 RepID=A0A3M0GB33_9ACTN|nr:hypothetical protein [Tessaracoccus antarcticus]RMB58199.1 hypothetical protein EAX62_13370 [Tessaracoccus antarcticus]